MPLSLDMNNQLVTTHDLHRILPRANKIGYVCPGLFPTEFRSGDEWLLAGNGDAGLACFQVGQSQCGFAGHCCFLPAGTIFPPNVGLASYHAASLEMAYLYPTTDILKVDFENAVNRLGWMVCHHAVEPLLVNNNPDDPRLRVIFDVIQHHATCQGDDNYDDICQMDPNDVVVIFSLLSSYHSFKDLVQDVKGCSLIAPFLVAYDDIDPNDHMLLFSAKSGIDHAIGI
eukprot:GILJ01025269.1.p1 GENE.GILJ01025269.1~~GILJ01025269.1.p1  ORF type:complete len:228 (-),score=17.81 GILJ01025269.1:12-695(-)